MAIVYDYNLPREFEQSGYRTTRVYCTIAVDRMLDFTKKWHRKEFETQFSSDWESELSWLKRKIALVVVVKK